MRAAVELAKDWRTDKYLRNLEAMMIVADAEMMLILTGNGDVLEPEGGIAAIGSGGNYALAAAGRWPITSRIPKKLARRAMADRRRSLRLHQRPADGRDVDPLERSRIGADPTPSRRTNADTHPKAIVAALDEHIVGQDDAKKAVAVALRNRWRRQQLAPELREEVTPKNILMIGPTGCGKTEISRRLAKLADAPFVKVEATKFTEVGYVGRDVEQIARDLVEEAVRLERERRRDEVRDGGRGSGDGAAARRADRQGLERGDPRQLPPALRRRQPRRRRGRDRGRTRRPTMPFDIPGMGGRSA